MSEDHIDRAQTFTVQFDPAWNMWIAASDGHPDLYERGEEPHEALEALIATLEDHAPLRRSTTEAFLSAGYDSTFLASWDACVHDRYMRNRPAWAMQRLREWQQAGYDPSETVEWLSAGLVQPDEARWLREAGVNADQAQRYREAWMHLYNTEPSAWAVLDEDDWVVWCAAGVPADTAALCLQADVAVEEVYELQASHRDGEDLTSKLRLLAALRQGRCRK